MRIKIVVENNKEGKVEISVPNKEIRDVYDAMYMAHDCWDTIKLNKCDKSFLSFHRKLEHIVHDVLDGGKYYYKNKKGKYVLSKKRGFLVKKSKWRK